MRKIASIILTLTVIAMSSQSCMKEIAGEAQSLAGTWFRTDEDKSTEYITFEKGKVEHWLSTKKLYIVDNKAWGHSAAHLMLQTRTLYSVQGSAIFAIPDNELLWSFTHSSEGEMTLTNPESSQTSTWHKVEGLEKSPYTRLSVSQTKFDLSFSECNRNHEIRLSADRILPQILELGVEPEHAIAFAFNNGLATVSGSDWLHITGTTESGFTFCPEINDKTPRNGYLYINFPGADEQTIAVSVQSGEDISADTDKTQIGYAAGTHTIALNLNTEVEISCTETWISNIHISNGNLYFTASENNTGSTRFGRIILSNPDAVEDLVIHITQTYTASTLTLSHESKEFDYNAHSGNMFRYSIENMHEGLSVEITCDADWCTLNTNSNSVTYNVDENNSGRARTAKITVRYGDIEKVFTIKQSYVAPTLTLSSYSHTFGHEGGESSFTYTITNPRSSGYIEVLYTTTERWFQFTHDKNSKKISISAFENSDPEAFKTGIIHVWYRSSNSSFIELKATYNIKQEFSAPSLSLETNEVITDHHDGCFNIAFTLNNPRKDSQLEINCNSSWITHTLNDGNIELNIAQNTQSETRSANITVSYANTTYEYAAQTITVTQKGTPTNLSAEGPANCYIISQSGLYMFKPTQGNSDTSVGDIASVESLWESFGTDIAPQKGDLISNVTLFKDGYIGFEKPKTFKEGNAVIAAKDANGNILWSWHIWSVEDAIKEHKYANNAGVLMDRNLGATSATPGDARAFGLLYQWGRKDPFLSSSSIDKAQMAKSTITWPNLVESNHTSGTIKYAIEHPTTIICYTELNGISDWVHSEKHENRWADYTKTIYDPCPKGWRIPSGDWIDGFWSTTFNTKNQFPAYIYLDIFDTQNKGVTLSSPYCDADAWYPSAANISPYKAKIGQPIENMLNMNRSVCYYGSYGNIQECQTFFFYVEDATKPKTRITPGGNESDKWSARPVRCMKE